MSANFASVLLIGIVLSVTAIPARAGDAPPEAATTPPVAAKLRVQVLGRVKNPGTYVLDSGTRLSDALIAADAGFARLVARVGGPLVVDTDCVLGGPSLRNVFLTRTSETAKSTTYMIDVSITRQQRDLRYDPLLQNDDRILVPDCRPKIRVIATPPTFPSSQG